MLKAQWGRQPAERLLMMGKTGLLRAARMEGTPAGTVASGHTHSRARLRSKLLTLWSKL